MLGLLRGWWASPYGVGFAKMEGEIVSMQILGGIYADGMLWG
jgi:hypothetical protein